MTHEPSYALSGPPAKQIIFVGFRLSLPFSYYRSPLNGLLVITNILSEIFVLIKTITKFANVIGHYQPDFSTTRTVYASCL